MLICESFAIRDGVGSVGLVYDQRHNCVVPSGYNAVLVDGEGNS